MSGSLLGKPSRSMNSCAASSPLLGPRPNEKCCHVHSPRLREPWNHRRVGGLSAAVCLDVMPYGERVA
jgi:hypothetical protein